MMASFTTKTRLLRVASIVRQIATIFSLFPGEKKNLNNEADFKITPSCKSPIHCELRLIDC